MFENLKPKRKHWEISGEKTLPSLNELCKSEDGNQIKRVLEKAKLMRTGHRFSNNGYTKKRQGIGRYVADIPVEIYINPLSPFRHFFHPDMDWKQRKKAMFEFLRRYPEFLVVDKL